MLDILSKIALILLSLDTIRAIIAMLGWIKTDAKYAWLIYGRRDNNVVYSALKELGFSGRQEQEFIKKSVRKTSKEYSKITGITKDNAAIHLVLLLAKYTIKFDDEIRYGEGEKTLHSNYYIDTMEISYNEDDLNKLCALMVILIETKIKKNMDILFCPKGGSPIFVQRVSDAIQARMIVAKASDDNSRIEGKSSHGKDFFRVNYEGSWDAIDSKKRQNSIIVDCNTSDGGQLLNIISEVGEILIYNRDIKILNPAFAFVLFCANVDCTKIDEVFKPRNTKLIRYFDLDEEIKEMLYELKINSINEKRFPNVISNDDCQFAEKIIELLKQKGNFYYS